MEKLIQDAQQLFNVHLIGRHVIALVTYERELIAWNEQFNLTAIRDVEGIRTKHFLDSFSCVLAWKEQPPRRLVDVGTGAGFPGLALKILYPSMHLTLVESVGKKVKFLEHMVEKLALQDVTVLHARAEDVGNDSNYRERYDWAVARAVAQMPILAEYLLPLVRVGGNMLAQKGESGPAEAQAAQHAFTVLGAELERVMPVTLPGVAEDRYLVVARKKAATPRAYPRAAGLPSKKPL